MKVLLVFSGKSPSLLKGQDSQFKIFVDNISKKVELRTMRISYLREQDEISNDFQNQDVDFNITQNTEFTAQTNMGQRLEAALGVTIQAQEYLKSWKPDVIHLLDRGAWLPFRSYKNTVYSLENPVMQNLSLRDINEYWLGEHQMDKDACAKADALIVQSESMRKVVWNNFCDFAAPIFIPMGFSIDQFFCKKSNDCIIFSIFDPVDNLNKWLTEVFQAVETLPADLFTKYSLDFRLYRKSEFPKEILPKRFRYFPIEDFDSMVQGLAESHIVLFPFVNHQTKYSIRAALSSGAFLLSARSPGNTDDIVTGKNGIFMEGATLDIREKLELVLSNPGKYLGKEDIIRKDAKIWDWGLCVDEYYKVYHQVSVGRSIYMKWAHGQMTQDFCIQRNQLEQLRKKNLGPLFESILLNMDNVKTLVIGSTPMEQEIFSRTGYKTTFVSYQQENSFGLRQTPEFILSRNENFTQTVFIAGVEFSVNPDLALLEVLRVTSHKIILGITLGEKLVFGQKFMWNSEDELLKAFALVPPWEPRIEKSLDFLEEYSGLKRKMVILILEKESSNLGGAL